MLKKIFFFLLIIFSLIIPATADDSYGNNIYTDQYNDESPSEILSDSVSFFSSFEDFDTVRSNEIEIGDPIIR